MNRFTLQVSLIRIQVEPLEIQRIKSKVKG